MDGRKESKYNLAGTCPECGKLIKVEHIICVNLVETGTTTKTEDKDTALVEKSIESGEKTHVVFANPNFYIISSFLKTDYFLLAFASLYR